MLYNVCSVCVSESERMSQISATVNIRMLVELREEETRSTIILLYYYYYYIRVIWSNMASIKKNKKSRAHL